MLQLFQKYSEEFFIQMILFPCNTCYSNSINGVPEFLPSNTYSSFSGNMENFFIWTILIPCNTCYRVSRNAPWNFFLVTHVTRTCYICQNGALASRFNEWPSSAHFHSLNRDFTLNRDFLMWNFILVTRFHTLNRDFTLNRDSLNRDFTVFMDWSENNNNKKEVKSSKNAVKWVTQDHKFWWAHHFLGIIGEFADFLWIPRQTKFHRIAALSGCFQHERRIHAKEP